MIAVIQLLHQHSCRCSTLTGYALHLLSDDNTLVSDNQNLIVFLDGCKASYKVLFPFSSRLELDSHNADTTSRLSSKCRRWNAFAVSSRGDSQDVFLILLLHLFVAAVKDVHVGNRVTLFQLERSHAATSAASCAEFFRRKSGRLAILGANQHVIPVLAEMGPYKTIAIGQGGNSQAATGDFLKSGKRRLFDITLFCRKHNELIFDEFRHRQYGIDGVV
mmetsp:Transcript_26599/g.44387  ORF Transcript_26599/g.44387 Transcript_26599/m.44387 type:complete len:219 (-) Transcript_26599:1430-2086(-)